MAERTEELTQDIDATREHMSETIDAIGDRVSPSRVASRRWEQTREASYRMRERMMGAPRSAAASGRSAGGDLASSVGDAAGSVRSTITSAPDMVQERTQGNPLVLGAMAFGIGVLIGSAAPPSQEETKLAERVVPKVKDEAASVARDVADSTKDQAQQAMDQVKSAASDAAGAVQDKAKDAAQQTTQKASDAKDEVTSQASSSAAEVRQQSS